MPIQGKNLPRYMTVSGVAEQYSLSRKTVYRLIDAGKLEATYLTPRALRVSVASIEALVAKNTTAVAGGAH